MECSKCRLIEKPERVKDIFSEQQNLLQSLKRQSRQAIRYKNIQNDIRRIEAGIFYKKISIAEKNLKEDKEKLENHEKNVSEQTIEVAKINTKYENKQSEMPSIRDKDSEISSELQKYNLNLENLKRDLDRLVASEGELKVRLKQR